MEVLIISTSTKSTKKEAICEIPTTKNRMLRQQTRARKGFLNFDFLKTEVFSLENSIKEATDSTPSM